MVHKWLAKASTEGSLQDVVCALERILDILNTRKTGSSSEDEAATARRQPKNAVLEVLNGNSFISMLKSDVPNETGELLRCVSLLFFVPVTESSTTGKEHRSLVNAFVSSIDSPICCAVTRGEAETVETYLALLVLAKVVLLSSTKRRIFKTADYKSLTFLEWLGLVKFFGRSKRKEACRNLYGEWALHAGNDDTLQVLTHNEYTLRELASLVCTSPFGRLFVTRSDFFASGRVEKDIDFDKLFSSAIVNEFSAPTSEPRGVNALISDEDEKKCDCSTTDESVGNDHWASKVYRPKPDAVDRKAPQSSKTDAAVQTVDPLSCIEAVQAHVATSSTVSAQAIVRLSASSTEPTTTTTNPLSCGAKLQPPAPTVSYDSSEQSAVLVEVDEDDFFVVAKEELNDSMDTDWEILS